MKIQRRHFIKNTIAGAVSVSVAGFFPGLMLKGCSLKTNNNKTNIGRLPNDKPVVYKIKTDGGKVNYVGVAQRARVQDRLKEHLLGGKDYVPGAKVQIEQVGSIAEARRIEAVAKIGDKLRILDLTDPAVRSAVYSADSAKSIYEGPFAQDY